MTYLLVPSPLLGPATWAPVAELLGGRVVTVDAVEPGPADVVLVVHSNAGLHAPLLASRLGARATVYVDAALAGDGPDTGLAPPRFLDFLTGLADDDGLLPPWTHWWSEDDVRDLFPDPSTRARVEAEQPRLPLSYFSSRVEVPPGWADRPSAYLAFGETYADEIATARGRGWPVTVLRGRHLHQLVDPDEVAAAITDLVDRAGR
ncbi:MULTISPECIES: alpha/beta fold hydrolase [unclassified Nocardioides]|uniref:alpha/beta fold hydrolase n=1 Tax=unclassified Nocardioides TaxID=2615069 RepID=UPI000B2FEE65|nr:MULTISPECIES: alpha/beta fold hydrolase [unclassified Nocardioides]